MKVISNLPLDFNDCPEFHSFNEHWMLPGLNNYVSDFVWKGIYSWGCILKGSQIGALKIDTFLTNQMITHPSLNCVLFFNIVNHLYRINNLNMERKNI